MKRVQDNAPALSKTERAWLKKNLAEQRARHQRIIADMEALSPQRDEWIDQFLDRIQTRGFNYNCDAMRKIPDEEMPQQPKRKFKVVF